MFAKDKKKLLLEDYEVSQTAFDEMWMNATDIRPHWQRVVRQVQTLGAEELTLRKSELQRFLKENGVTYTVYGSPQGEAHPWKLDPIPFVLPAEVWKTLERGLKQRAHLLSLILADLYGERKLIRAGILPVELLFSDRNFLRPCVGMSVEQQLLLYAADISRGPNGRIWVIGDRTQAPSGWSYALENRIAMARVLPELFAKNHVRKILNFYSFSREALVQFSPKGNPDPHIVLLTPGSMNETYFEHAYLAAMQGFTLAQGQDLMVKDNFVWLKTLGGLEKVDIIVRRVDDNYCDPLSLKADSQLGVPGLLEVARVGNVRIANPLGSGVLENPGLMAFLPAVSQYFLQEDLILPNIATWWCGQEKERHYVFENLNQLVIKNIGQQSGRRTIFGWEQSQEQLAQLKRAIQAFPHLYVAQEQAIFSLSPAFQDNQLTPRHTALRSFLVATSGGYEMMPGGLTRSAPDAGNRHVSGQSGGISKDTWVLSEQQEESMRIENSPFSVLFPHKTIDELPSRTAENLFWIGRYGMRILYLAHLLRTTLRYQAEIENFEESSDTDIFQILLRAITHLSMTYPGFVGKEGEKNLNGPEEELRSILFDTKKMGSLAHSISMWRSGANTVRDRWTSDTWRIFDKTADDWNKLCTKPDIGMRKVRSALDKLVNNIAALIGLTQGSMSGEEGLPMLGIGMDLERGLQLTGLLRATIAVKNAPNIERNIIEAVLINNQSLTTYRYRYRNHFSLNSLLDLILLDTNYPPSLAFAINRLQRRLAQLPSVNPSGKLRPDQKFALQAFTSLQLADTEQLPTTSVDSVVREELDQLLADVSNSLAKCGNQMIQVYFSHIGEKQQQSMPLSNAGV